MSEQKDFPTGLNRCSVCGKYKGIVNDDYWGLVDVWCLCKGPICSHCGIGRIYRPVSKFYSEDRGRILHTSIFGALKECPHCGKTGGFGQVFISPVH
jgi:hypothetical protein